MLRRPQSGLLPITPITVVIPAGGYTYTLQFLLPPGFNPATATISGRWAARTTRLHVSEFVTGAPAPAAQFLSGLDVLYHTCGSRFVSGLNTLSFTVTNIFDDNTGLRVEFTNAFANCSTCAPPVIHLDHSGTILAGVQYRHVQCRGGRHAAIDLPVVPQ